MRFEVFSVCNFGKETVCCLKRLVCGCANAVLAILSFNMRLQVSVSVHFSYQINMCYITPWACIMTISLLSVLAFSCQTWLCFMWYLDLLEYTSCVKPTNEKDFVPRDKKCHPKVTVGQI